MRVRLLAVAAFALLLTACSSMDDVRVVHACPEKLEVVVTHLSAIEPEGGEQEYWEQVFRGEAPPERITTVTGIINLYRHDLVLVGVEGSTWRIELSRSELRGLDGPIVIPESACP